MSRIIKARLSWVKAKIHESLGLDTMLIESAMKADGNWEKVTHVRAQRLNVNLPLSPSLEVDRREHAFAPAERQDAVVLAVAQLYFKLVFLNAGILPAHGDFSRMRAFCLDVVLVSPNLLFGCFVRAALGSVRMFCSSVPLFCSGVFFGLLRVLNAALFFLKEKTFGFYAWGAQAPPNAKKQI